MIKLTRSNAFVVDVTTLQLNLKKRKTATAVFLMLEDWLQR